MNSKKRFMILYEIYLKSLHRRILLAGTSYKDTRSIYNQILKDIEFEERFIFNVKL